MSTKSNLTPAAIFPGLAGTTQSADEIRAAVVALATEYGLAYSAEFVPQSQSRNAGEKTFSLNWRVVLARSPRANMAVDYMQGIGHVPGNAFDFRPTARNIEIQQASAERGVYFTAGQKLNWWAGQPGRCHGTKIPAPHIADVLHCLILDAAVLDFPQFENWAAEYGYDVDSRAGEKVYRQCLAQALELRVLLGGDAGIEKFRAILADY